MGRIPEQIKSAINRIIDTRDYKYSHFSFVDDTGKAFDLALRSLNAWSEVLTELEHDKEICFAHDSDEGFVYARVIELINQKLEQNEEYFERFIYPIAYDEPFNEAIKNKTYNQALEDFANALIDGEQNEEFVYNIEKIVRRLRK